MTQSLTDQLKGHIEAAVEANKQGDNIDWDLGSGMGPQGQLFHFMTLVIPSPILGDTIATTGMIMNAREVTGEQVAQLVQQSLEALRAARTEKLTGELPPQTNVSGLTLP